jgi:hypothetical protein
MRKTHAKLDRVLFHVRLPAILCRHIILILEKFDVATGANLLQIPVRIREDDHRFVVDTGASFTILDIAHCAGERLAVIRVGTPTADVSLNLYTAPTRKGHAVQQRLAIGGG